MTGPIEVRKGLCQSPGEAWNAFIELISGAVLEDLSPVQRIAYLAWWYSSEVLNGGHDQYFLNKECFDHHEVVAALDALGALCQSTILKEAMAYVSKAKNEMPDGYEAYLAWDQKYGYSSQMTSFDMRFYECKPEIEIELLERYLQENEAHFIRWVS